MMKEVIQKLLTSKDARNVSPKQLDPVEKEASPWQ
jgi:hypothetical protein